MNPADPAQAITIVIPVYRDEPATRACLESVAASELPQGASVLVIDDASPEPALREFCAGFCKAHGYTLLANDSNQGFVRTANIGLAHEPGADVVLLNSDTTVANDWLARLQNQAYASGDIGTVTPFSNNGTICSYPVFADSSELPDGWTAAQIDRLCATANAGMNAQLPTAVGFCMYIRHDCLANVGLFDAEQFGQGYGEECDFSLRAASKGWSNVLAADVFIYHAGNASFGGQTNQRKQAADKVMQDLHPDYDQLVSDFLQRDPLRQLRLRVDLQRLAERPDDLAQVLAEHGRYAQSILKRSEAMRGERLALLAERDTLETMLGETRSAFEAADTGLRNADALVQEQQQELRRLDSYARSLVEHIEKMEQSRSWRYTRWLRRKQ